MSRIRLGVALLAAAALACVVLGPASARTPAPAKYGGTLVVGLSGRPRQPRPDAEPRRQRDLLGHVPAALRPRRQAAAGPGARRRAAGALEGQAQLHDPAAQGDRVQRRHAVQRAGGRHHGPALHDLPRLGPRQRLRGRRQRHRVRAVHRRLPPESAGLDVHRRPTRTSSRRRSWTSSAPTSGRTRSASARSCSTTASPATTSP